MSAGYPYSVAYGWGSSGCLSSTYLPRYSFDRNKVGLVYKAYLIFENLTTNYNYNIQVGLQLYGDSDYTQPSWSSAGSGVTFSTTTAVIGITLLRKLTTNTISVVPGYKVWINNRSAKNIKFKDIIIGISLNTFDSTLNSTLMSGIAQGTVISTAMRNGGVDCYTSSLQGNTGVWSNYVIGTPVHHLLHTGLDTALGLSTSGGIITAATAKTLFSLFSYFPASASIILPVFKSYCGVTNMSIAKHT